MSRALMAARRPGPPPGGVCPLRRESTFRYYRAMFSLRRAARAVFRSDNEPSSEESAVTYEKWVEDEDEVSSELGMNREKDLALSKDSEKTTESHDSGNKVAEEKCFLIQANGDQAREPQSSTRHTSSDAIQMPSASKDLGHLG